MIISHSSLAIWESLSDIHGMEYFYLWVIGIGTLIALIFTIKALWGYRQVRADAISDYAYRTQEGMLSDRISQERYVRAYCRFNAPRSTAYMAGAFWAILLLTYPFLALIQFVLEQWWIATGRSVVIEPGFLVWQFMIFFAVIGLWAAIAYVTARRYHRRTMISLEREIQKDMEAGGY